MQFCLKVNICCLELVMADGKEESDVGVGYCGVLTDEALTATPFV
jgi:hypothetical protein